MEPSRLWWGITDHKVQGRAKVEVRVRVKLGARGLVRVTYYIVGVRGRIRQRVSVRIRVGFWARIKMGPTRLLTLEISRGKAIMRLKVGVSVKNWGWGKVNIRDRVGVKSQL